MDIQEILFIVLVVAAAVFLVAAIITAQLDKKKQIRKRLAEQGDDFEQPMDPQAGRVAGAFSKIGKVASSGRQSANLRQRLAAAGLHDRSAPPIFLGVKVTFLATGFIILAIVLWPMSIMFPLKVLAMAVGGGLLFFGPDIFLQTLISRRRQDIVHHLPDAVDLLEVCVSSGMGLEMAWNLVASEIREVSQNLADEMALTDLEIHLGASRIDSMRHMAERTGAGGLWSLAAVLAQSERFGTSIADALRVFAATMRETRSANAEEGAEKMAVKLLFPMMLLIFPAIIIVVAGPAAIQMADKLFTI